MQDSSLIRKDWITITSIFLLLGSIGGFVYSSEMRFLAVFPAWLFLVLLWINWKSAYWCLLACIPFSIHFFFSGRSLSTSLPDEPMMWVFLLFFIMAFSANPRLLPRWWWKNPLTLIVFFQMVWLLIAVIYSQQLFFSVKFLLAKCWFMVSYMIIPVFVFKTKADFKKGFWLFFIPLLITVCIVFARHLFIYKLQYNPGIERAIAFLYYNHVDYSTVLSMFFPVLCIAFGLTDKKRRRLKWGLFILILFFLTAIIFAYARAAMLAVIFSAVIYFAIRKRLVNWIMPVFYGSITMLMVFLIKDSNYIILRPDYERTFTHKSFQSHLLATFRGEDMSSMERLYRWIAAVRMSEEHPITGFGPNSFYYYYKPYAVQMFRTYVSRNPEQSTTHNYFLLMLVEQGWPAMILYGLLVMVFFAQAQKIYFRFRDKFYKQVTLAMAMMFAAGFVNNFFSELLETHKVGALFFLSISLLIILDRKSRQPDPS